MYMEMEKEEKNIEFWRDITIITEEELSKLRKIDPNTRGESSSLRVVPLQK